MSTVKHASINEVIKKGNNLRSELISAIDEKADKATTYSKDETYSRAEADAKLDEKANSASVYIKQEVDSKLSTKADLVEGVVPASQLPSYVDDVLEFENMAKFPTEGERGKIYVATDTNLTYRWSGSQYVEISQSLALGETASTAYAGDKGKKVTDALAAHKADTANPHAVTAAQVGAYTKQEVDEKIDAAKPADYDEVKAKAESALQEETDPVFTEWKGGATIELGSGASAHETVFDRTGIAIGLDAKSRNGGVAIGAGTIATFDESYAVGRVSVPFSPTTSYIRAAVAAAKYSFCFAQSPKLIYFNAYNTSTEQKTLQSYLDERVPTTRTVNGKALSADVTLSADDVDALPATKAGVQYTVGSDVEIAGGLYVDGGLYKRGGTDDPYLPKTELDAAYAPLSTTPTKTEVANTYATKTEVANTYATKTALEALAATVGEANNLLESVA